MGRAPRPGIAGATYHITARGNAGADIFSDDYDRYAYLALLARAVRLMEVRVFAYSLMTNHVHLVLQTTAPNVSTAVQRLHGPYAYAYNRRYGRRGHLFEGRFRSKLIEEDSYLLEATRYTHLNPVRGGLVDLPENYPWSSFRFYLAADARAPQTIVDVWPVLKLFNEDPVASRAAYERFVREGMPVA